MANIKSAQKAIRVTKRRTSRNRSVKQSFKEVRKDLINSIKSGDVKKAKELFPKFQAEIDKAVKKAVIKRNTGARYKSRVAKALTKSSSKK